MTLETIDAYDAERVRTQGDHAVVVGGSMAGLVTARVLADAYHRVTVIERDELPDEPVTRRGVPQGRHVHALHEGGRATLDDLFEGYSDALAAAGAPVVDIATDFRFYDEGDFVADGHEQFPMYCASRPLFEHVTRRRLRATDGVTVRDGCRLTDYRTDDGAVTGAEVREGGDRETVRADIVVDATGRTSRTPSWLANHGYPEPAEETVTVDLAYSTVYVDRPAGDRRAFQVMPCPPRRRGGVALPVEGDRWVVTLFGVHGDHPPTSVDALRSFARDLPVDAFHDLLAERAVVSGDVNHYPVPSNRRRRYWDLDRFPDGLLVVGDAVASFNPIYGQGMSVAALGALQLHHALAAGDDGLAARFFDRVEAVVDDAWNVAVGTDFRFPETSGPKPPGTDLLNRYLGRLTRKAHDDSRLADAYTRVVTMERPPTSLLRPRVAWRVLRPSVGPLQAAFEPASD